MFYLSRLHWPGVTGFIEIAVLALLFYFIISFFSGTRGAQVLTGFVLSLLLLMFLTQFLRLDALNWLLRQFSVYLSVAIVIIFQPEIRRALAELGRQPSFGSPRAGKGLAEKLVKAVYTLAGRKIGALIAIEREIGTRSIQETGTRLNARLSPELLASIFFPHTPLHDGGVIIKDDKIVAAGCIFPLSNREQLSRSLGTRHRAAIGLTDETDAVVLVISEETGTVSVAYRGKLVRGLDEDRLRRILQRLLSRGKPGRARAARVKEQLRLSPENPLADSALFSREDDDAE